LSYGTRQAAYGVPLPQVFLPKSNIIQDQLKEEVMHKLKICTLLAAGFALLLSGCSDKNSSEACLHAVSMNLDKGNYDAVLNSSCADAMQKGAAYFGKAGYNMTVVINSFIQTGITSNSTSSARKDLNVYMTSLVTNATQASLEHINNAIGSYELVRTSSGYTFDNYKDAQFYISLVDTVKALSVINIVLPGILDASGNLNTTCDANGNQLPDPVDATSCALIVSTAITTGSSTLSCSGATYARSSPIDLTLKDSLGSVITGTYSGLIITIATSTSGTTSGCTLRDPNPDITHYKRLLYKDSLGNYRAATTGSAICTDDAGEKWQCPLLDVQGQPVDLVRTIDESLTNAVSALGVAAANASDVKQAITDIKAQACPSGTCTSIDIANYLQNNLK
jgi:hypothetical protein